MKHPHTFAFSIELSPRGIVFSNFFTLFIHCMQ